MTAPAQRARFRDLVGVEPGRGAAVGERPHRHAVALPRPAANAGVLRRRRGEQLTRDFEKAREFYGDVLGLPCSGRWGDMPAAEFEAGTVTIAVMQSDAFGLEFQPHTHPIALQVEDVAAARETLESRGGIKTSTYYVPGLIALGIVSTTFVNLAIGLTIERENRQLKRIRGTPLPIPAFIAGRVATALALATALTIVLLAVGRVGYGVSLPGSTIPGVALSLLVGTGAFCCLGFAFATAIPNEDAAPPLVNAVVLPLYFISGLFFPTDGAPAWLTTLADVFPIKHLAEALFEAFDPATTGAGVAWADLGIVAAWGAAGFAVAVATFRWTPKGE